MTAAETVGRVKQAVYEIPLRWGTDHPHGVTLEEIAHHLHLDPAIVEPAVWLLVRTGELHLRVFQQQR